MKKSRSKYTSPEFQFACFRLSGHDFGIDITAVKEIIKYRSLEKAPGCPSFIEGFLKVRHMSLPMIDLRKKFFPGDAGANEPSTAMIVSVAGHVVGLMVDEVNDIVMGGREISRVEAGSEQLKGPVDTVIEAGGKSINIINLADLFTKRELESLSAAYSGEAL